MITRCTNPNSKDYEHYSALGVCFEWLTFDNFLADMGERPSENHSIDRIDNSLGYFKDNCRWATPTQQSQNRRSTLLTPELVRTIRNRLAEGATQAQLGREFNVSSRVIGHVAHGRTWKNVA
jgi:hypothetical protein